VLDGEAFVDCNSRAVQMFGCDDKRGIIGHSPAGFSPAAQPDGRGSPAAMTERTRAALSGKPQRFCWQFQRRDGTPFDAEFSMNALELRGKKYLQAVIRDITGSRRAEGAAS
jgi:PAS domain S-box-containing protein